MACAPPPTKQVPELAVVVLKGLNEAQAESLSAMARKTADENVGMAMLYTIADELKTWLIENNAPPQDDSMFATMQRREKERKAGGAAAARSGSSEEGDGVGAGGGAKKAMTEEEEEAERNRQKILEGTAVTPESFAAWKAAFEAEMSGSAAAEEVSLKPSGRSYFAAGADLEAWEEPDEEVDGAAAVDEGAAAAEGGVDASLFLGEDDLDSDDEDFDDDDEEEDEEEEEDDDDDDDDEE